MMFDTDDREPGDELEDFGEDLSSDYREEEDELGVDDGEMPEEEISYEVEEPMGRVPQIVTPPPPPAPAKAVRRAPAPRKPAKKAAKPPKKTTKKPTKKAKPAKKAAKPKKAKKPAKAKKTATKKKSKRR